MKRERFEHDLILYKLANSFAKTTGIEFSELFSEASLAYAEALNTYKENSKASKTTYMYKVVYNALVDYCRREKLQKRKIVFTDLRLEMMDCVDLIDWINTPLLEKIKNFPEEQKFIINLVLEFQVELCQVPPKMAHGKISDKLHENGWPWSKVWANLRGLKQSIKDSLTEI